MMPAMTMYPLKKATKLPTAIAFALARVSSISFLRLLPRGYFMLCGERRQSAFSDLAALVGTFRLANANSFCDVRFPRARE